MSLSLGNDLSTTVGIQVDSANNKAKSLGQSLATGRNASVEVVDAFLGRSLESNAIILGAVAKNTAYTVNLLSITDEYLRTVVSSLQTGLKIISSSGSASADSLVVLQKNINDNKTQIGLLIGTASFDGKNLLKGDATNIDVQVGLHVTDKLSVKIDDISGGKLFRSSIAKGLNDAIASAAGAGTTYYNTANAATELNVDTLNNNNLVYAAILGSDFNAVTGGHGSGNSMTTAQLGTLLFNMTAVQKAQMDQIAPIAVAALTAANAGVTFVNATAVQLQAWTASQFPSVATMTTAVNSILGAVADNSATATGAAYLLTAGDVNTYIQGLANIPAAAKTAAATEFALGRLTYTSHNNARNAIRTVAYNALLASGGPYEMLLRSYTAPGGAAFDPATAVTLASLVQLTPANTNTAVQASGTIPAAVKATALATLNAGLTSNDIVTAAAFDASELGLILQDNVATNISVTGNVPNRVLAQDVFQNALNTILSLQANVASQKSNVSAASDALRATTNVTQQAADSYLKTDYVLAAQEYSETIRTMVAAITSLQAANKIPEAAQRLIDVLAR